MISRFHLKVALSQLPSELLFFQERQIHPEIVLSPSDLEALDWRQLSSLGAELADSGLIPTLHAPFHDLNPGGLEPLVLDATRQRFSQTFDCAQRLGAALIVFHPGYEFWKYGGQDRLWIESSLRFWPPFIQRAESSNCRIALENVFDTGPDPLATLLDQFDSPWIGHCFDIGHWHLFSSIPLSHWISRFERHLLHLHLHDNTGNADDHLLPGSGEIDFKTLAANLCRPGLSPSATLELPNRSDWESAVQWSRTFSCTVPPSDPAEPRNQRVSANS